MNSSRSQANLWLRNRMRLCKALIYTFLLLFFLLLFGDPFIFRPTFRLNLMLPLVGCALLFEGPCATAGIAVACGFLTDFVQNTFFGLNAAVFLLVSMLLWIIVKAWLRPVMLNGFFCSMILSFAVNMTDCLVTYGMDAQLFLKLYHPSTLAAPFFAFGLFFLVRWIYRRFRFVL